MTVVVVFCHVLLKEECLEGSRGRRKRRKEVNPCKDQGGEELVAVLRIAVLFLFFFSGN